MLLQIPWRKAILRDPFLHNSQKFNHVKCVSPAETPPPNSLGLLPSSSSSSSLPPLPSGDIPTGPEASTGRGIKLTLYDATAGSQGRARGKSCRLQTSLEFAPTRWKRQVVQRNLGAGKRMRGNCKNISIYSTYIWAACDAAMTKNFAMQTMTKFKFVFACDLEYWWFSS